MSLSINELMERASQSLAKMQYLDSEQDCLRALALAREQQDWAMYARILLPLQEVRRQRRMTAADGWVLLGCESPDIALDAIQTQGPGCIVFARPITPQQAQDLSRDLALRRLYIETLYADNSRDDDTWHITAIDGPAVHVARPAPPRPWRDHLLTQDEPWPGEMPVKGIAPRPADWFIDSTEALGDAALASVTAPTGSLQRIEQLEACLKVVVDHEILHQRLAQAARAIAGIPSSH